MLKLIGLLVCATLLIAQPGPGQGFGMGPGPAGAGMERVPPTPTALKDFLGLTDDQVTRLTAVQTARRDALKPVAEQMRAKNQELRSLMKAANADSAAVGKLVQEIAALRKQMQTISDGFAIQAQAILTASQAAKLAELRKALELMPAARQAIGLQLIEPPTAEDGPMAGVFGGRGAGRGAPMGRAGQFGFGFRR